VPVIASHSSLRHFTPGWERNMDDAMVQALGEKGGVVMINFGSTFVSQKAQDVDKARDEAVAAFTEGRGLDEDDPAVAEFLAEYDRTTPRLFATTADVADHIDRAVELAGIDHVGLGSDFDGVGDTLPVGLKDVSQYPNLFAELRKRGYTDEDIQ